MIGSLLLAYCVVLRGTNCVRGEILVAYRVVSRAQIVLGDTKFEICCQSTYSEIHDLDSLKVQGIE